MFMLIMIALASAPIGFAIGYSAKGFRRHSISPMYRSFR